MKLPFELDPQIIHHIIYSQAGSIGKAVIELLMNSVDAQATSVSLSMTREGFACRDDGTGFASREDVIRYFGRFGTPHEEGDATYGRFRLGRGQIMAHASTVWCSNAWQMNVDTRTMGYSYELDDLAQPRQGCEITGWWYEPLGDSEWMSAVQEVRDLVRYTPIRVELNGQLITRDPNAEQWDAEDDFAWYRVKAEGAVSIYNQGVLVRHDPSHQWGAGGLIVSKKGIGLNVSRTEILRKTCPVWKAIAKQFGGMANEIAARLGDHRKTEARRENSARAMLAGDMQIATLYMKEEVITVLPGKRHVSIEQFLRRCRYSHNRQFAVVEDGFDVPKAEAIAREGIALLVHPKTLERFGCYNAHDFVECIERIHFNLRQDVESNGTQFWGLNGLYEPELVAFATLRDAFVERTQLVTERDTLDKETRRAWTALRCCLGHYAALCTGGDLRRSGGSGCIRGGKRFHILLGDSNKAEAWTDGATYIAVNIKVVNRLRTDPLKTVAYIFSVIEHEIAHEGDSLDCGHDEAFYQRFHDLTLRYSQERQRFMHLWLMKYTASMEGEGKRASGEAWRERYLVDRAGSGRMKKGLSPAIEDLSTDPVVVDPVPAENIAFIDYQNVRLVEAGVCPEPPDWSAVLGRARVEQQAVEGEQRAEARQKAVERARDQAEEDAWWAELCAADEADRQRFAAVLGVPGEAISDEAVSYLQVNKGGDAGLHAIWADKPWVEIDYPDNYDFGGDPGFDPDFCDPASTEVAHSSEEARQVFWGIPDELHDAIQPGETLWALERNAAAAGFLNVDAYLRWRAEDQLAAGDTQTVG
jgi:hypothetical protein